MSKGSVVTNAKEIIARRERKGWSQDKLASEAAKYKEGKDDTDMRRSIQRAEAGRHIRLSTLAAIARALGCEPVEIMPAESQSQEGLQWRSPFERYIEEKSAGFIGREFVFAELEAFRQKEDRGYCVIIGEPGIGKTSISAYLVNTYKYIHHFNDEISRIVDAEIFLENICLQLRERYSKGAAYDAEKDFRNGLYLNRLLNDISRGLTDGDQVIIVVDALDEAAVDQGATNRLYLPADLPGGIYFIVTTRHLVVQPLIANCPRSDIYLEADSSQNLADIRHYINLIIERGQLRQPLQLSGLEAQHFVQTVEAKSEGSFMYLHHVLPEIERGEMRADDLPQGLEGYYERHWQKMRSRNIEVWLKYQQPVISVLAAFSEYMTANNIAEFAPGLTSTQVASVISEWLPFLRQRIEDGQIRYRLYHLTFQEFLKKKEEVGELDLSESRDNIIERLKEWWKPAT